MSADSARYDVVTIGFHWVTAALVLALFGTALTWTYTPRDWGLRWLSGIHVTLGVALAIAVIGRLLWRMTAGRRLPNEQNGVANLAAKSVHLLLYGLLLGQIGLGIAINWLDGDALSIFGMFSIPSPVVGNRDLGHKFEQLHNVVAWTLMALVGGHAMAALWHSYRIRDGVLQRMLPSLPAR